MSTEITDRNKIESILEKSKYLRLGLCNENIPYVIPMCFGYEKGRIYIHTGKKGKKLEIIKNNSNVCFETDILHETLSSDNPCAYNMKYQSVIGFGKAVIVDEEAKIREGLKIIIAHYHNGCYDIDSLKTDRLSIIRIDIESLTGRENKMN